MKSKLINLLSSYKTSLVLLLLYAILLAVATFIEKYEGTAFAKEIIYHSPLVFVLLILLILNFLLSTFKKCLSSKKKLGYLFIHCSFIVILTGAFISYLWGEEGILHLREGEKSNQIFIQGKEEVTVKNLPFSVELVKFTLKRYPGSYSPSSYESELIVHTDGEKYLHTISVNKVLDIKGYRFFQASYDSDEKGSVLSVNKDVAGRNVTYAGYIILLIGFVLCLTERNSRFKQLSRKLKELNTYGKTLTAIALLFVSCSAYANTEIAKEILKQNPIDEKQAALFGELPLQTINGRIVPMNTFSSEVLRKLYKAEKIEGLNSDEFLLSLLVMPDVWANIPLIVVSNPDIISYYGLPQKIAAYSDFVDSNGTYKLHEKLEDAYHKTAQQQTSFDKDLIKLDEKVNIVSQLFSHRLLNFFPKEDDLNNTWYAPGDDLSMFVDKDSMFVSRIFTWYLSEVENGLRTGNWEKAEEVLNMIHTYQNAKNKTIDISPKKIQAEIRFNRLNIFRTCKIAYLILGGLLLCTCFVSLFKKNRITNILSLILGIGILGAFCYHIYGMGLRWYIAGYAPWSNSYETMVYVALATVLAGLCFARKSNITLALATLFGGIILFVSGLNWMDPQINPLVPVLKSPWLMFHVAVIVAAYGFFGISFLIGIINLILISVRNSKNYSLVTLRIKELSIINEMSLITGLALMTIGTFLGAVWANETWGRYWGWDPKETWALITVVVYAIVIHLRLVKSLDNLWIFNLSSVLSFASVLMTYFGVNYFLSGIHSYGQNDSINGIFVYLYSILFVILILAVFSFWKWRKREGRK